MSTSGTGSVAGYISKLHQPVRFCVSILLVSVIYMAYIIRSHKHIYDVTNFFTIAIFWIKLVLNIPNFLTRSSLAASMRPVLHFDACRSLDIFFASGLA
jgi:hypothetical protein